MKIKNMNDFAKAICKAEKGKKELNITQVRTVLRHTADLIMMGNYNNIYIFEDYMRYRVRRISKMRKKK